MKTNKNQSTLRKSGAQLPVHSHLSPKIFLVTLGISAWVGFVALMASGAIG